MLFDFAIIGFGVIGTEILNGVKKNLLKKKNKKKELKEIEQLKEIEKFKKSIELKKNKLNKLNKNNIIKGGNYLNFDMTTIEHIIFGIFLIFIIDIFYNLNPKN